MDNETPYELTIDGITFHSSSPLDEEFVRRKIKQLKSDAFGVKPATTAEEAEKLLVKL